LVSKKYPAINAYIPWKGKKYQAIKCACTLLKKEKISRNSMRMHLGRKIR